MYEARERETRKRIEKRREEKQKLKLKHKTAWMLLVFSATCARYSHDDVYRVRVSIKSGIESIE